MRSFFRIRGPNYLCEFDGDRLYETAWAGAVSAWGGPVETCATRNSPAGPLSFRRDDDYGTEQIRF